ncbi:MAG: DNA polymerase III subunit delta' [Bacteroidaceae bacterium]|nr:DNA polymerase III subunit delta' [Bacteroidaceae bacterium]
MYFKNIIGQEEAKRRIVQEVGEGRVPHARLICGPEGSGKLPLAVAYARYLCCTDRQGGEACGRCPSCVKFDKLVHPDVHFVFPVKSSSNVSDDFLREWRSLMLKSPYFSFPQWMETMGVENQQPLIGVRESDVIARKLNLKASAGGYKVMIIWLPEKMNVQSANKLLKLLEEPPRQTVFLLVSEQPDTLLSTIQSRTQRMELRKLAEPEVKRALEEHYGLQEADAATVAHLSGGSFLKALESIRLSEDSRAFFDLFVSLMRLSYQRKLREMKLWSEQVAAMGREKQKHFLDYCQRSLRENFIFNFRRQELVYMTPEEQAFSQRFAPYVNERNVMGIMEELALAQQHVEQNVNPKMIFFDFALKMIMLLKSN